MNICISVVYILYQMIFILMYINILLVICDLYIKKNNLLYFSEDTTKRQKT